MIKQLVKIAFAVLLAAMSAMAQVKPVQTPGAVYWAGKSSDGLSFVLELLPTGDMRLIPMTGVVSKGKWKQKDKTMEMELNRNYIRLTGVVDGDHLEGKAMTRRGVQWAWSATKQPEVIETAAPAYPPLAMTARVGGLVWVDVEIEASGKVIAVESIKGHPLLRDNIKRAALRYRFQPATGAETRHAQLTFIFTLLDVDEQTVKVVSPLILSPYQIEIRRGWARIQYERSSRAARQ